ncbi:hypothetical protein LC040_06105 [Bacillus tianshenii]|nr:hypothetical protein LC040_06105 [Bacillus tianshenii]
MAALSNYLENAMINAVLRGVQYTSPQKVYVGLFLSDPTDKNNGTEVSAASYERQAITFEEPVDGETSNNKDVLFPVTTEDWGTITHIGLYDAQTAGNLLWRGQLEFSKEIVLSSQFKIPRNYLIVRLK